MEKQSWNIKELYPNIYQIEEYKGVHMTLIKGKDKAILWDMGYGVYNLPELLEEMVDTPLVVLASHGHPDHTLGYSWFKEIYVSKKDFKYIRKYNSKFSKKALVKSLEKHHIFNREDSKAYLKRKNPKLRDLKEDMVFDLGDIHARAVSLPGHTPGSMGLLLEEAEILLTGDEICNDLWLFLPESQSISVNIETLKKALELPFKHFVMAHKKELYPKKHINNIIDNMENISLKTSKETRILHRYDVYDSRIKTPYGDSSILYTEDKM